MTFKRVIKRPKNIFNKLLLTSSLTIVATVITLIVFITNYYSDVLIQNELDLSARLLERADNYYTEKETEVTQLIRNLYADKELGDDLSYSLLNGYSEYFKYRLDRYVENPAFIPTNFTTFFKDYFNHDDEIIAFVLRSEIEPSMSYEFVYQQAEWSALVDQGLMQQVTNDSFTCKRGIMKTSDDIFEITRAINTPGTLSKMGCMTFIYSTSGLMNLSQKNQAETENIIVVLNDEDENIFSSDYDLSPGIVPQLLKSESNQLTWDGETYYVKSLSGKNNFTYYGLIPKKELNKLTLVKSTMWLFVILATIMAIFITYTFMRNYASRINQIDASIKEVQEGNLDVRIEDFKQNDELTRISDSFNMMLDDLNDYIDQAYVLNIQQQQAELKALQAQINPHFLFNTLEVIRMAAIVEGSKTSSKMIYHLSRLFRYTLESKDTVPLHTEMENTNQYFRLMQLHHPEKLAVITDVPKQYEDLPVPKLILQPIIENYMAYGFRKDRSDNRIMIKATQHEDTLQISVADNGSGFTSEKLAEVIKHLNDDEADHMKSIGLKNVHQRLKLNYGMEYGVSIVSEADQETIITLTIPIGGTIDV